MKFTKRTGYKFDRGDVKGFAYNTKEQFSRMSVALFTCNGAHPKMKSLDSDRLYFLIRGSGEFIINKKIIKVKTNEVVIIPKNTSNSYRGNMKCLLVHSPAFNRKNEIRFDNNIN
jgi:mannose-6-phosphate isomerase-like protein (cupin superfamily)